MPFEVGNQGAKNVKFTPNFTNFCNNVSCHIHIQWNEISQKNRKQKRGDLKKIWIPFIKFHETLQEYPPWCVAAFGRLKKFKMAAVAMVTKVSFSLLLLLLFFHTFLSARFLGDALIQLYETLQDLFLTSKNFYRSPFSKWPPQYRTNSTLFDFNKICICRQIMMT